MSPIIILCIIAVYFLALYGISYVTGKNASNSTFFLGNRKSPWYLVAFGMIGASISGVSFISVPGDVGKYHFGYMQMVLGYLLGYLVIGTILMPVYYRLQLTSIYTYLKERMGQFSYKTGASFFLLSRTVGSAFRLFLSAAVMQIVLFNQLNFPFWLTGLIIIFFIYIYTYKGGVRTVIFTDTIQTAFMLASLISCVFILSHKLNLDFGNMVKTIYHSSFSQLFVFDNWKSEQHFLKQFFSGTFIAIAMTGLDQDLMQKNLSCKNLKEAQKNMFWFSLALIPVNLLFLSLGAILFIFSSQTGFPIPAHTDDLFPVIAMQSFMPPVFGLIFILGLVSTTYSSADSALTALTTSFTLDILDAQKRGEIILAKVRKVVHVFMALFLFVLVLIFHAVNDQSVIRAVFKAAGFTYGPLLGMFAFGLFTKWQVKDKWVPLVAIASPVICLVLNFGFPGTFGFEILIINGILTFLGLIIIRKY
jgi:solute:Na+ symporter, SSS family